MICFFLFSFYYLVSSMIVEKQRTGEIVSGFSPFCFVFFSLSHHNIMYYTTSQEPERLGMICLAWSEEIGGGSSIRIVRKRRSVSFGVTSYYANYYYYHLGFVLYQ